MLTEVASARTPASSIDRRSVSGGRAALYSASPDTRGSALARSMNTRRSSACSQCRETEIRPGVVAWTSATFSMISNRCPRS